MLAILLITLVAIASLADPGLAFAVSPSPRKEESSNEDSASLLADLALQKVLKQASPIYGTTAVNYGAESDTATWMSAYHDETLLVHMNIPGTHDAATWNYSSATQDSLEYINDLANISAVRPDFYRCQARSIAAMLDAGIRVFDLRYALDVTRTNLVFWHGDALQSETASVDDVLFSLYNWLEWHKSEAIFLSFQYEGGGNDVITQAMLYATLTSPAARQYMVQARGELGTLGQARGKITLLRRFDLNLLAPMYENSIPGVHFSPNNWTDNGPDITLIYNETTGAAAYIEDYYQPLTPNNSTAETNIRWKVNATEAHLRKAASGDHPDSLYWTFASSTNTGNNPPITPVIQALGNGSKTTPDGGVNDQLLPFFESMRGKRLGIVMFDFYDDVAELVPTFLGLLGPDESASFSR
ncbi:1-phosphatidylinositol phosphodiesterase [Pseudocercospora fuligena]|uniref:1-phosphatidylinositol phosphodiesterase n=1 Tax=Pseudocercospora fuligena TaxID=685502 RepID=A0A8H6RH52_9PEZI|nr:1-phosphatidylinositol phosphodiesterase [Pseudocercospora fuligena]